MIQLKNKELEMVLLQIVAYDTKTQKPVAGLINESTSLGLKRKLQKIYSKSFEKYKEYIEEIKKIEKECGDNLEMRAKEIDILNNETVEIDAMPVDMKDIEAITTNNNYSFDVIELFAN